MSIFSSPRSRTVLALQGGGAHGAFTWGALDQLLEGGLRFDAVTGVSSGAMIAAMAVQGMVKNGPEGAREAVSKLWTRVMEGNLFGNFPATPLEPLLRELLDLKTLRAPEAPRLYVGATDVENGEAAWFSNAEVGIPHLLASACIPMMFPTVQIKGRHYWDGGYSCNPPLAPVLTPRPQTLILIRAQPRQRKGVPSSTADIVHRLHEIAFQAPLAAELALLPRQVRLLDISADDALAQHPLNSKLNTDRPFLEALFSAGRKAAARAMQAA